MRRMTWRAISGRPWAAAALAAALQRLATSFWTEDDGARDERKQAAAAVARIVTGTLRDVPCDASGRPVPSSSASKALIGSLGAEYPASLASRRGRAWQILLATPRHRMPIYSRNEGSECVG